MVIDVTKVLHDYKGEEITEEVRTKENGNIDIRLIPLTLKSALLTALNSFAPSEMISAEMKVHLNVLSIKIWQSTEVELSAEDIVLIKERVGIIWNSPSVYVEICNALDGKSAENMP